MTSRRHRHGLNASCGLLLAGLAAAAGAQDDVHSLPPVEVIERAPLPGFEVPAALYPGHAQRSSGPAPAPCPSS